MQYSGEQVMAPSGYMYSANLPTPEDIECMISNNVPRLLFIGLKRSGKTSILNTVCHQKSPQGTFHLDGSTRVERFELLSICNITFVDIPGSLDLERLSDEDAELIFGGTVAIVFVIDAMTSDRLKSNSVMKLCSIAKKASAVNPNINCEVLIHKLDSQTIQFKTQIQRMFERHVQDESYETKLDVIFTYHVTSIFNCSIHVALSKILQKLVPQSSTFEALLSNFVERSDSIQAYLVDLSSRLFFAKDSGALDPDVYELVIHYVDLMEDIVKQQDLSFRGEESATSGGGLVELDDGLVMVYSAINPFVGVVNVFRSSMLDRLSIIEYNIKALRATLQETLDYQEQQQEQLRQRFQQRRQLALRSLE